MATLPFQQPAAKRHREPLTGAKKIIVSVTIGFVIFLVWAMLAQVDEVTNRVLQRYGIEKDRFIAEPVPARSQKLAKD